MSNSHNSSKDKLLHIQKRRQESGAIGTLVGGVAVSLRAIETGKVPKMNIPHKEIGVYGVTDPDDYYSLRRDDIENLLRIAHNANNNQKLDGMERLLAINSSQIRLGQGIPGKTYFNPVEGPVAEKRHAIGSLYIDKGKLRMSIFDENGKPRKSVIDKICVILEIRE
ncbi:MAG: hypothetical protein PHN60_03265 [Candidatus Gracilibacteria bacterium]|nr:hypothetical protein [Candidatus Gracilibacteria bacterium]